MYKILNNKTIFVLVLLSLVLHTQLFAGSASWIKITTPGKKSTKARKSVILTFDDGPAPEKVLRKILKILKQNHIRAEFYLLGQEVSANRRATKSIVTQGHRAQNHSWSHVNLARASQSKVRSELRRTQNIIRKVTGRSPTKLRPPYGEGGWPWAKDRELSKVAKSLSLKIHNWDIDTNDWKRPAGLGSRKLSKIKTLLKKHTKKSRVSVLMHVNASTARDLPRFIRKLRQWGYTFARPR